MDEADSRKRQSIKIVSDPTTQKARVELLYPTISKFSGTLQLGLFPYDVQTFHLTYGSW